MGVTDNTTLNNSLTQFISGSINFSVDTSGYVSAGAKTLHSKGTKTVFTVHGISFLSDTVKNVLNSTRSSVIYWKHKIYQHKGRWMQLVT